jgi:hypothetical protein
MAAFLLAVVLAGAASQPASAVYPDRQARAVVRIVRPVKLRFDVAPDEGVLRASRVRERDGSLSAARLIEFY